MANTNCITPSQEEIIRAGTFGRIFVATRGVDPDNMTPEEVARVEEAVDHTLGCVPGYFTCIAQLLWVGPGHSSFDETELLGHLLDAMTATIHEADRWRGHCDSYWYQLRNGANPDGSKRGTNEALAGEVAQ